MSSVPGIGLKPTLEVMWDVAMWDRLLPANMDLALDLEREPREKLRRLKDRDVLEGTWHICIGQRDQTST